ncbi:hypothetical protein [Caecibacteroides pullorum]|uniref:Uncharacterized protein n=1 Tax=Caecibacteroides pullorum TaxID=2725562 RepID=A0AA40ZW12_9BACT|nr:hypothetical protein [Caecibacteroides pullorum]MBM6858792.1 hypothetical protein [Caecibacteroides pullorum]MBV8059802.1 hypothetical protein [Caecibacteroides pullorum]
MCAPRSLSRALPLPARLLPSASGFARRCWMRAASPPAHYINNHKSFAPPAMTK